MKNHDPRRRGRRLVDQLGVVASALCLVHCLATPLFLIMVPLAATDGFEGALAALLVGLATLSAGLALSRRELAPLLPYGVAVAALFLREGLSEGSVAERLVTSVLAIAIALTHLLSLRRIPR